MNGGYVIELKGVKKSFVKVKALDGVSFSVSRGEIFGLLGPNGAGKTTTIRTILGIILPDSGEIFIEGKRFSRDVVDRFGYLPEERGLYRKMKVADIISFFGRSKGVYGKELAEKIEIWLKRMDLYNYRSKKVEELSKGMQQKIQFIITIINDPNIIILDEPFSGLDPINRDLFKEIILELNGEGKTIIYSTHILEEAEKLSNSICLINKGKVLLRGRLSEIKEKYGKNSIVLECEGDISFLKGHDFFVDLDLYQNFAEFTLKEDITPEEVLKLALQRGIKIKRFEVMEPSLRKIFISNVKDEVLNEES